MSWPIGLNRYAGALTFRRGLHGILAVFHDNPPALPAFLSLSFSLIYTAAQQQTG